MIMQIIDRTFVNTFKQIQWLIGIGLYLDVILLCVGCQQLDVLYDIVSDGVFTLIKNSGSCQGISVYITIKYLVVISSTFCPFFDNALMWYLLHNKLNIQYLDPDQASEVIGD